MSKPNLKSQAKRKRELAKLDKRQAKDLKRAEKRAERSGDVAVTPTPAPSPMAAKPAPYGVRAAVPAPAAPAAPKPPMTLAAAALAWRTTKIAKPSRTRS